MRFEILKLLKETPMHGYAIFKILNESGSADQSSHLYKVLRSMERKGLISGKVKDSPRGPNKNIYTLTSSGIEAYYDRIIESARDYHQLLMDLIIKRNADLNRELLLDLGLKKEHLENKCIYFMGIYPNPSMIIGLIRSLFFNMDVPLTIYLKPTTRVQKRDLNHLKNTQVKVKLLDDNLDLKDNSIDLIYISGTKAKKILEHMLSKTKTLLKNKGHAIIFLRNEKKIKRFQIFETLIDEIFNDIPENSQLKLEELFPRLQYRSMREKMRSWQDVELLTNKQVSNIIESNFDVIEINKKLPTLDVFVCRPMVE